MTRLGKYELLEKLGEGRFGEVYKAQDNLGRLLAVKLLKAQWALDGDSLQRFQREAQAAGNLYHPQIATIHTFEEEGGRFFLVMRYIHGPTLAEQLKAQGALPWSQALEIAGQAADGLDYAHKRGFIHRDIKPSNILLGAEEGAVLTDFGLVKAVESSGMTSTGVTMGTPHYIPPEVWGGKAAGPAADVYALACVVYEMLTGEVLFAGESTPRIITQHVLEGPRFPPQWPQGVPAGVEAVLRQALAKEPGERYASAGELVKALEEAARGQAVETKPSAEEVAALRKQLKEAIRAGEWGQAKHAAEELLQALPGDADAQAGLEVAGEELALQAAEAARKAQEEAGRQQKQRQAQLEKLKRDAEAALEAMDTQKAMELAREWLAEAPADPEARTFLGKARQAEQDKPRWEAEQRAKREAEAEEKKRLEEEERKHLEELERVLHPERIYLAEGVYMEMVKVPAGEFLMGTEKEYEMEKPQRKVYLDEYWIGKYPVTNVQYAAYLRAGRGKAPEHWSGGKIPGGKEEHPVVSVSWEDAVAFCKWASQVSGRKIRLPSEAEREKAARGTDGRTYPWGESEPYFSLENYEENVDDDTAVVGKYSPYGDSPYGCADMVGNVWEWCADWYDGNYYKNAPYRNPQGPSSGECRVIRGGYYLDIGDWVSTSTRADMPPDDRDDNVGFRCAASIASP